MTKRERKSKKTQKKTARPRARKTEKVAAVPREIRRSFEGTFMPRALYIQMKIVRQNLEKRAIAEHVASRYIFDFDAVLLDAGSTAEAIAEEIFAKRKFLSVLTNNMGAYAAFTRSRAIGTGEPAQQVCRYDLRAADDRTENELLVTGGRYDDTYESLLGEGAITAIEPFTPNVIVLGISGLRCQEGLFCHGAEEAAVKKLLCCKQTDIRLIAADWTKIGKRDAHAFGKLEQLGINAERAVLVTCNPPDDVAPRDLESFEDQISLIEKLNVEVIRLNILEHR